MVFTIYLPQFLSKSPLVSPLLAAGKQRGKERGADGEGEGAMPVFKEEEEAESWTPAILILSVHSCFCFWLTDLKSMSLSN